MARSVICAVVLLASCGRVGFEVATDATSSGADGPGGPEALIDARPCVAPSGHDEDGDSIDDACDLCPQVADLQADLDADGVGDACDLDDTTAQLITFFDPYLGARAEWEYLGPYTFGGDTLVVDALTQGAGQNLIGTPGRDRYQLVGHVDATDPLSSQVSLGLGNQDGIGSYYCEFYEAGAELYLSFTYTEDGVSYTTQDKQSLVGPLVDQDFVLSLDHTPPTVTCRATFRGAELVATGVIPTTLASDVLYTAQYRIAVTLRSFIAIHSS
ncbi:MAG: hypothetical protein H0T79_23725 [Deltaproteobacteria bacterium]|nr:hypothetical protein [Deltaproteobacteria bacterium]